MVNNKKVIKVQCPFEKIKRYNANSEAALYKAVIMQMIIDASNISDDPKASRNEKRAKEWLFSGGNDFKLVCQMAGIETNIVVQLAQVLIKIHHEKESKIKKRQKNSMENIKNCNKTSQTILNNKLNNARNKIQNLCLMPFLKLN